MNPALYINAYLRSAKQRVYRRHLATVVEIEAQYRAGIVDAASAMARLKLLPRRKR